MNSADGIAFPLLFGVGTSVPVILIGIPLALGLMRFAGAFNILGRVERAMRTVAAITFIGAGGFMLWGWMTGFI